MKAQPLETYLTMADLISCYLHHHPDYALIPESVISIGVLAALANICHGNDRINQWADIRALADAALKILSNTTPSMFAPGEEADLKGSPLKESCKAANPAIAVRPDDSRLNRGEAMAASSIANRLKGTTLVKFAPEDQLLIDNAILTPTEIDFGQYNRLVRLVGVMSA